MFLSGDRLEGWGSCKGDSGGPLMKLDLTGQHEQFVQLGVVHGGVGECGNTDFPNIFARLEDPKVLKFIKETMGKA